MAESHTRYRPVSYTHLEKLSEDERTDCGRTVRKISSDVGEKMKTLKIGELTARIPVIQGGMGVGISLSGLAGSVAACGGVGAVSYTHLDVYKRQGRNLEKCWSRWN